MSMANATTALRRHHVLNTMFMDVVGRLRMGKVELLVSLERSGKIPRLLSLVEASETGVIGPVAMAAHECCRRGNGAVVSCEEVWRNGGGVG